MRISAFIKTQAVLEQNIGVSNYRSTYRDNLWNTFNYYIKYITNSLHQRNLWDADSRSTVQNITSILRNAHVKCRVRKSLLLGPIMSHVNRIHVLKSNFTNFLFNTNLSTTPRVSKTFLSLSTDFSCPSYVLRNTRSVFRRVKFVKWIFPVFVFPRQVCWWVVKCLRKVWQGEG